jgi:hypothetical protein
MINYSDHQEAGDIIADNSAMSSHLLDAKSVLLAGREVRETLEEEDDRRIFAAQQLSNAAQRYCAEETSRIYKFTEPSTEANHDQSIQQQSSMDLLTSILLDVQVSQVLIASGGVRGEVGEKLHPQFLDESLDRLDSTTQMIAGAGKTSTHFRFTKPSTRLNQPQSKTLEEAIATFRNYSDETLTLLVNEAQESIKSIVQGLAEMGPEKLSSIIETVGKQVQALPKIGQLIGQGIHILEEAIRTLQKFLDNKNLTAITSKLKPVWDDLTKGQTMNQALEWVLGIEPLRKQIYEILQSDHLDLTKLDSASCELIQLQATYRETIAITQRISSTLSTVSILLPFIPGVMPEGAAFIASAYGVLLAVVTFINLDYIDIPSTIGWVRGINPIVQEITN